MEYKNTIKFVEERSRFLVKQLETIENRKQDFKKENKLSDIKFNADQNVRLKQGYLETSNVSVFDELINNTEIQKQYQLNVKLIALAKEMVEAGSALMRLPNN